jgi:hypothetical protein
MGSVRNARQLTPKAAPKKSTVKSKSYLADDAVMIEPVD